MFNTFLNIQLKIFLGQTPVSQDNFLFSFGKKTEHKCERCRKDFTNFMRQN